MQWRWEVRECCKCEECERHKQEECEVHKRKEREEQEACKRRSWEDREKSVHEEVRRGKVSAHHLK